MPGGLLNIISYANTDFYLTALPQITFFKNSYRRYTNFSQESIDVPINNLKFNDITEIIIPRIGDLIHKLYLEIKLPEVAITRDDINISSINIDEYNKLKEEQKQVLLQYKIIEDFIKLNIEAYSAGMNDLEAINVSDPSGIIETILETCKLELSSSYNTLLKKYNFNYNLSNIYEKMNHLKIQLKTLYTYNNDHNYYKQLIKNELITAINECKIIKNYFNNLLKILNNKINEYISPLIKFAWKDKLGYLLIEWIEIYIGSELIDKHYSNWFEISSKLFDDNKYYDEMLGNIEILTNYDNTIKPEYKLIIPLHFWFCKLSGLAFPNVALQHNEIKLRIKLRDISKCCKIEINSISNDLNDTDEIISTIWNNKNLILQGNIIVEYIYLDNEERKKFAHSAHEYLIEVIERNEFKNISNNEFRCELNFRGSTKEIIWILYEDINPFKYIPINSSKLTMGDIELINNNIPYYLTAYKYHSRIPIENINIISFALRPEEHQPSGITNLSMINNLVLSIKFDRDPNKKYILEVFTIRYNILRLLGGYGALAYN